MTTLFVGGTFDANGGKPSKVFENFVDGYMEQAKEHNLYYNGGGLSLLYNVIISNRFHGVDTCIWCPNVSNSENKLVQHLKIRNPRMLLITSKLNIDDEYSIGDVISHSLGCKANLTVEIKKTYKGQYCGRLLDPLGNEFCELTTDFRQIGRMSALRKVDLGLVIRKPSFSMGSVLGPSLSPPSACQKFIDIVRKSGERFSELLPSSSENERFLGNASFRCGYGFPSIKYDNTIFVSRRDINKQKISLDEFISVKLGDNGETLYQGDLKPSVDTPIQLRLYDYYGNIRYMLHGHTYVKDGIFTSHVIPCGGLQEVDEIISVLPDKDVKFARINLLGHGCFIMVDENNLDYIKNSVLYSRSSPEHQGDFTIPAMI